MLNKSTNEYEKGLLRFLERMFMVASAVIINKTRFHTVPIDRLLLFNSLHRICILKNNVGITKEIQLRGICYPYCWIVLENTKHHGKEENICHEDYILEEPDLKKIWNELENFTVSGYKKFHEYPEKKDLFFGKQSGKTLTKVYYRGNNLDLPYSKDRENFIFPIGDRYLPIIKKELKRAEQFKLINTFDNSKKLWQNDLNKVLHDAIISYDNKLGVLASFVKRNLHGHVTKCYRSKNHSTTAIPKHCSDDNVDTWLHCKYKIPTSKFDSNCERRKNGFCRHSEAKRKILSELETTDSEGLTSDNDVVVKLEERQEKDKSWNKISKECTDEIDNKIIACLKNKDFEFDNSTAKDFLKQINYSKVAQYLKNNSGISISYKTVQRRLKRIISHVKK